MTPQRLVPFLLLLGLSLGATGCVVRESCYPVIRTYYTANTHAYYRAPRLVYLSPGVQVVYDYEQPVFYSDGYYWRYDTGYWYRSSYHSYGWVRWDNYAVPRAVVTIDRPNYYVRYRGGVRPPVRPVYTPPPPRVRDHRAPVYVRPAPVRVAPPTVRVQANVNVSGAATVHTRDHR